MSDDFAARCKGCGFIWNSPVMADGLRVIGACPKCKGELEFGIRAGTPPEPGSGAEPAPDPEAAPHMVLGVPRR